MLVAASFGVSALFSLVFGIELEINGWIMLLVFLPISHFLLMAMRGRVSRDFRIICKRAVAPLQTPIIILGGILVGVFTPTEASAIAVAYALLISFFVLRTMKLRDLPEILTKSALGSSTVLLLVGAAVAFKVVVSLSHAPEQMAAFVLTLSEKPADPSVFDQPAPVRGGHVFGCGARDHYSGSYIGTSVC